MHYPDADGFDRIDPEAAGFDRDALTAAIEYHLTHGTPHEQVNYDFANLDPWDESEGEYGRRIGPMPDRRGGPAGIVLKDGKLVAEWGDTRRVDQTFSVAKSVLSLVGGIAFDRGRIDLDEPVRRTIRDGGFETEHNQTITWRQLFEQTSEWEGTLFGKPDSVDRNRAVGKTDRLNKVDTRELQEPGTFFEYNDIRINRLALCLLRVLGRPLPRVLAEEVMTPIGATNTWSWHGYYNSAVDIDGTAMKSVSGGGHWGGGLWISTRDLARLGHLMLNRGRWDSNQILSEEWVDRSISPSEINENYGLLWWLNTNQRLWPSVSESSYAALGHGQNAVWVDPDDNLVVVLRWLELSEKRDETEQIPNQDAAYGRFVSALKSA